MTDNPIPIPTFSDIINNSMSGRILVGSDIGIDEVGNPVVTADLGPVEVSTYISQDDGAIVIQIDCASIPSSEHHTLRVYYNDTTIHSIGEEESSPKEGTDSIG